MINPHKERSKVSKDVLILPHDSGNWILYNVFTQDSLAVNTTALKVLSLVAEGKSEEEMAKVVQGEELCLWDVHFFAQVASPLADPTRIIRDYKDWPEVQRVKLSSFVEVLIQKHFLIEEEAKYKAMFAPKISFLDKEHLGNFHQQIGKKLIFEKRIDPSDWWTKQKFNADYSDLNETLYKAVQGNFLKDFFQARLSSSTRVVDLGCGVGYYTKLMGKTGAEVLGVDPSEKYISLAGKNILKNVQFKCSKIGQQGDLDWLPAHSFDFVFMSDALSFYFVPSTFITADQSQKPDINVLFADIKRILKPTGSFISVEPNGLFLFRPWLGEIERPFTIITEYNHPWYNVVQHYSQAIQAFLKGGFIIKEMKDLAVSEEFMKIEPRGTHFAKEFPLWCFFELGLPPRES